MRLNYPKGQEGQGIIGSQGDPNNSQCDDDVCWRCVQVPVCLGMYMKNLSSFTHTDIVSNLNDFLSSVEHKKNIFYKKSVGSTVKVCDICCQR